jgi:hypothetical protein
LGPKEFADVRRDLDLIRKLALAVEDASADALVNGIDIEGYTPEEVGYHSYLLVDSGLAEGVDIGTMHQALPDWRILHLTSAGHDFADAARDESRWKKATGVVKDKAGTVTLDVVKQVLVSIIKNTLGL